MNTSSPQTDEAVPVKEKKQFPCKQCGAKLVFDPAASALKCPYCSFENVIPKSAEQIEEQDYQTFLAKLANEKDTHQQALVHCDKCGAETSLGANTTAGACPFCGAPVVVKNATTKLIKPQGVLPFKVTQQQAFEDFSKWIGSLWFAPSDLKQYARQEHQLSGVYVPYWTYDSDTKTFYTGMRGDDYTETETYTEYENGKPVTRTRTVTKTRWSNASGVVWESFNDILVIASTSLPTKYAVALEPWDLSNLATYSDEYLSGFKAESYQIDLPTGFSKAREVMEVEIHRAICRDIGGDHQQVSSAKTQYDHITFKHLLLPIWISAYEYRGKLFHILVNARTGEVQGERPYSAIKITLLVITILIAIAAVVLMAQR